MRVNLHASSSRMSKSTSNTSVYYSVFTWHAPLLLLFLVGSCLVALCQIAVMGDQSCGKSSVLEALSGVQFPRGSGLVTRCPVQLIMKRTKPGDGWHGG